MNGMRCWLHDELLEDCPVCEFKRDERGVFRDKNGLSLSDQFTRNDFGRYGRPRVSTWDQWRLAVRRLRRHAEEHRAMVAEVNRLAKEAQRATSGR